ncbi:MAG: D-alanyl-D-alanine carboxypeptidase, partial [Rhodobacterales bacterium]
PAPVVAAVNPPAIIPQRPGDAADAVPAAQMAEALPFAVADSADLAAVEALAETVAQTVAEAPDLATGTQTSAAIEVASAVAPRASIKPRARPASLVILASLPADAAVAAASPPVAANTEPDVVTRLSTSSGRHWGINVGRYGSRHAAEKVLLQTALTEINTLDGTLRKVVPGNGGFDANFMGMTRETADLACRRLQVRQVQCFMIAPS